MNASPSCPGRIYGLGLGPGDPDLMSLRAHRLLTGARNVAYFRKAGRRGQGGKQQAESQAQACQQAREVFHVVSFRDVPAAEQAPRPAGLPLRQQTTFSDPGSMPVAIPQKHEIAFCLWRVLIIRG